MPCAKVKVSEAQDTDVLILGGGPAGCATALSLRRHAGDLSLVLIEGSSYDRVRAGEVLPSVARDLLHQLGVFDAFANEGHRVVYSAVASWGRQYPFENHFVYSARGPAWHIDRARFDGFLAQEAARRGVKVLTGTRMHKVKRSSHGWTMQLSDGQTLRARFIVDATGRHAVLGTSAGARRIATDRLFAFARFFTLEDETPPQTLIESFSDGWWYTALAGDRRVVTCLTDIDIVRKLALWDFESWLRVMKRTQWISAVVSDTSSGPLIPKAVNSAYLEPVCERDWIAVGDAAVSYDPLSSQGITKALRSGILASYAIADRLSKEDEGGLRRYQELVRREFGSYRRALAKYYSEERRWSDNAFWRRRQKEAYETPGIGL